ncbi:MAG TPA: hypothetical protein VN496_10685 [Burkholderiales bacterium]|nr:hypothetical protein [Burkholderiales bacterium]
MRQLLAGILLLIGSAASFAAETDTNGSGGVPGLSHSLTVELQNFLRQRNIDVDQLSAGEMVSVMVDWYRLTPVKKVQGDVAGDALVYRYGGWSEGCATAFKLSLLRRVTVRDASGADDERLAGITMMFEPSAQAELMPFSAVASDANSIGVFVTAVESSPAFQLLAGATPMGVMVESGGVR